MIQQRKDLSAILGPLLRTLRALTFFATLSGRCETINLPDSALVLPFYSLFSPLSVLLPFLTSQSRGRRVSAFQCYATTAFRGLRGEGRPMLRRAWFSRPPLPYYVHTHTYPIHETEAMNLRARETSIGGIFHDC